MLAPSNFAGNLLAVHESQQPQPFQDVRSPLIQSPLQCPSLPRTHDYEEFSVPENLGWLRDTVIELFVDQEGFRAAHLAFRFVGFRKQVRGWDSLDGGWALFRPLNRESFRFHYAPLDSLPVLRRLTINGDETHDYISRQASLSLKTNGVYVVQGSESPHLPASCLSGSPKTNVCPAKLSWKFEYLVDNRTERTGRILDGEKTLTPLMFTCSPWLLHRSQGRKMKLMHVVKKSVIIKLVAEKLEPPALPSRLRSLPAKPVASHHLWTFHRRVQSHIDEPKMGNLKKTGSFRQADERSETKKRPDENQGFAVGRRRRASSAGEDRRPKSESCSTALRLPENTALGRHILSRAQLADLMNTEKKEADGGSRCSVGKLPSLSPAPRR
ncbi:hypothetical protein GGX14DRAFT_420248 [Mycena pura]|uniref:Uncharacterized protein n=1 Tax=Mycena pura TaxID=153505 RepID=A0AAD6YP22_9AGAR|nr:hypothetical protein GGX14DRAFT_420248 [Mycena pura]